MPTTVLAVYQDGVLHPAHPLPLAEGETVEVTVTEVKNTPLTEEEAIRRIKSAKTLEEVFAAANTAPQPPDGYDLLEALNENRIRNGERPLIPPESREESR